MPRRLLSEPTVLGVEANFSFSNNGSPALWKELGLWCSETEISDCDYDYVFVMISIIFGFDRSFFIALSSAAYTTVYSFRC